VREISDKKPRLNQSIRASEVRLIGEGGEQMGIRPVAEALSMAEEQGLDLVEVAPAAKPPVCRLMDYGKYQYERTKRERQSRKSQRTAEVKEIRMHPKTGQHDKDFKIKQMRKFLASGAKVKVRVRFRGREMSHRELGRQLLMDIARSIEDVGVVEQFPRMEGRSLLMILAPSSK
jgi:translation initiation factor IF-3